MAIGNDENGYDWPLPQSRAADRNKKQDLYDSDQPILNSKDTVIELVTTLVGIAGVFALIIALVKAFH